MAQGEWRPAPQPGQPVEARVPQGPRPSLTALIERYCRTHVAGQAQGTREAKRRDLACFLHFYTQYLGRDEVRAWETSVTEAFVKAMARDPIARPSPTGVPQPTRLSPSTRARTGNALSRKDAFAILQRMARQTNAHLPAEEHLHVAPQVLRHTFLYTVANEKGVQHAMVLSGHRSDRYIWRYMQPDVQSLADALDTPTEAREGGAPLSIDTGMEAPRRRSSRRVPSRETMEVSGSRPAREGDPG